MPVKDYRAYAQSPKGQAARARARARYVQKRRDEQTARTWNARPLIEALTNWKAS